MTREIEDEERRDAWETDPRILLERVMRAGEVGVWESDPESGRAEWNDTLRELVGVDASHPASLEAWLELVHPEDRGIAVRTSDPGRTEEEGRYRIVRPDGEVRHVLVRADWIVNESGSDRLVGVVIDITESHQASAQVISTLESISDGYFAIDRDWTVSYINQTGQAILGASKSDLVGRNLWEAYPEAVGSTFERYRETMDHGVQLEFEEFYPPLEKWFEVRSYPTPYGIAVYFRDVTSRHEAEEERTRMLEAERSARELAELAEARVAHQATHDSLTGLLNRTELMRQLKSCLTDGDKVTILFLDVDRFKLVNDSLGHGVGDELLRTVARRLRRFANGDNPVARFGGDEFVIGLPGWDQESAFVLAERVLEEIRKPMELGENLIYATASIGIADARGNVGADDLIRNADVALYKAKDTGRDRAVWFDEELRADLVRRLDLEQRLRDSLGQDALHLDFQPSFELRTGRLSQIEALARWDDRILGPVPPGAFIPVAEESGLIHRVGSWATLSTVKAARSWSSATGESHRFWVNISPRELARPDAAGMFRRNLEDSGLDPGCLGVEITESALAGEDIVEGLRQVADLGIKVAIDDFGTGYSSISRLGGLPVDYLKIDRSFVNRIGSDSGMGTISAIVDLAHAIGATVVAEGVETREQLEALATTECDLVSGFLLARPCSLEDLERSGSAGSSILQTRLGELR